MYENSVLNIWQPIFLVLILKKLLKISFSGFNNLPFQSAYLHEHSSLFIFIVYIHHFGILIHKCWITSGSHFRMGSLPVLQQWIYYVFVRRPQFVCIYVCSDRMPSLIARFMGPSWGPSGADKTQVGPCWPHELCYLGCVIRWSQC